MHSTRIVGLVAVALLAACTAPSAEKVEGKMNGASTTMVEEPAKEMEIPASAKNQAQFLDAAIEASKRQGGELVNAKVVAGQTPAAVVVRYRSGGADGTPICSLVIIEGSASEPKVVEESDSLLGCSLSIDAKTVGEQMGLAVGDGEIRLTNDGEKGSERFELRRHGGGGWYVTKANFSQAEDDPETGDVIVVNEVVAYPIESRKIQVSAYSYDAVSADLVRTEVE